MYSIRRLSTKFLFLFILTCGIPISTFAQQKSQIEVASPTPELLVVENSGLDDVDAQSAAMLIIEEFRKFNISVSDPVFKDPKTGNIYRLSFRRLGEKILVRLSQEMSGAIAVEREIWINNIEEMIKVAPRLVDAIVNNKPLSSTVEIEQVTGHEAAAYEKLAGESLWNVGIFSTFLPGTEVFAKPGWEIGWGYQTPRYAVGTEFRFSGGVSDSEDYMFALWSIGGRYFFNKKNITPYVGGGFSIIGLSYYDYDYNNYHSYYGSNDDNGLGAYFVGGVEMLRLTKSRLKFELRVDRPFFSLSDQDIMPITFGIFFSQHYLPGGGCSLF